MNKVLQGLGNAGIILAEGGETTHRRRLLGSASDRDGVSLGPGLRAGGGQGSGTGMWGRGLWLERWVETQRKDPTRCPSN